MVPAVSHFLRPLDALLDETPLFDWGRFRAADLAHSIHWLYARTGEAWLLPLAEKARRQAYDWAAHFADFRYSEKVRPEQLSLATHVVNNAMAVKWAGVWLRQSGDAGAARRIAAEMVATLDRYHGQVTGVFSGDEHYAGRSPSQGTELCAVVEYMYSLELLLSALGDAAWGDRLERIAFNALPATFKPDMWAHQYDQQANQAQCVVAEDRVYVNNGPDANIYGLEPNYGCCTANLHQGWPKFAAHLWMATPDGGLAAAAYAPSEVTATVAGQVVRLTLETDYPFREELRLRVVPEGTAHFPLRLRIPAWAEGATVRVNGEAEQVAAPGGFHMLAREWHPGDEVAPTPAMAPRLERRYHNSATILRGPSGLQPAIGEDGARSAGSPPWRLGSAADHAVETMPLRDAVAPSPRRSSSAGQWRSALFAGGAPMVAHMRGRRLPGWGVVHNAAGDLPESPVPTAEAVPESEPLDLIPYGCTNLRISEFPVLG